MKKTLLLTFALLMSVSIFAQTRDTFISESFDGPSMPAGWEIMDYGATNWSISATSNAGGSANELSLYYSPQFNGTSRVVMPAVDLTGVSSVVVSFKHALDNYSGSHTIGIATTSDGGTTWNEGWSQSYSNDGVYVINQPITTPDMGNSEVRFCIFYTGYSYNIDNWYFDDIEIFSQNNLDLSLSSIDVDAVLPAGSTEIAATVMNKGLTNVTNFVMAYQFEGSESVEESFDVNLPSLGSTQVTFAVPANLLPGTYNLSLNIISVNGSNDDDPNNNSLSKDVSITLGSTQKIPMIEHFSSSTCGPCVSVNTQMLNLTNNNPGKFTYTKYQMSWPGSGDPYYTAEGGTRRQYYGVNAVPQVFMDGTDQGYAAVTQANLDNNYNTPAFSDVRGSFNVNGTTITVKVDFMSFYDIQTEKAFVSVNEKLTTGNVGSNGETSFHHVFMKFLTSASGDALNIPAGEYQHFEFTQDLSTTFVEEMSDLEVAAWIQDLSTKEISNSHFMYEYTDVHPYPVQNFTFTNDGDVLRAAWEAPEGDNATGYNVYLNGELVAENTTALEYTIPVEENLFVVCVEAVYPNDMTSVKLVKSINGTTISVAENAMSFDIYPNPTNDAFTISGQNINEVEVYNLCGQKVMSINANANNVNVNMTGFAAGIYMVRITDNNGNTTVNKVVKR